MRSTSGSSRRSPREAESTYLGLGTAAARRLRKRRTASTEFIPHSPWPRQREFLALDDVLDVGYGGAAGGGKSDALLMAMLAYVDVPGYAALILRRTYRELARAGALMFRANQWLESTDAKWRPKDRAWEFPSGARLEFGFCKHKGDLKQYKSAEYAAIGIDQAEDWPEDELEYFFTRTRAPDTVKVPWRFRCTFNPGGVGRHHLKKRYLSPPLEANTAFVPCARGDNPSMDAKYGAVLAKVKGADGTRMRDGDFDVEDAGGVFERTNFSIVDVFNADGARIVRAWDLAATKPVAGQKLPDWTRGVKMAERDGRYWVLHVASVMDDPGGVERLVVQTAQVDGRRVPIRIKQERGSAGKSIIDVYRRMPELAGYDIDGVWETGDKVARATSFARAVGRDHTVSVLRGEWTQEFLDECEGFPEGRWDDQVDAACTAFEELDRGGVLEVVGGGGRRVTRGIGKVFS